MKIITVEFDYFQANTYNILGAVFQESVKENAPGVNFESLKRKPPLINHHRRCDVSNTEKLDDWIAMMDKTNEDMIFADCDMLCMNDPSKAFDDDFDIGITKRTSGAIPFNGGIVLVKNTDKARAFIKLWDVINDRLFENPTKHSYWASKRRYAGMNQAALGCIWEERLKLDSNVIAGKIYDTPVCKIKLFPCLQWNSCREDWGIIDPKKTFFIHIKSEMRTQCLAGKTPVNQIEIKYRETVDIWRNYAEKVKAPLLAKTYVKRTNPKKEEFTLNRFSYPDYTAYTQEQKAITELKVKKGTPTWANRDNIKFLSDFLKKTVGASGTLKFGICHGTRQGEEQAWFRKFTSADVIGTEIWEGAKDYPYTVIWDFNQENSAWLGKFDFIYTNAFDHVYLPGKTFLTWIKTLNTRGILIIEFTKKHDKAKPTKTDPVSFSTADIIDGVKNWTNGTWQVSRILDAPSSKSIGRKPEGVKFIIIERTKKNKTMK